MHVKVLGSAAGGGFPQWNCACHNCRRLRRGQLRSSARTQAQVAISGPGTEWLLLNASPDLRTQILSTPLLAPVREPRDTPIGGVVLTSADVDSVAGLLHLREFQPLRIYATASVRRILLEENRIFRVLERANTSTIWQDIALDTWFSIALGSSGEKTSFRCRAVFLGGAYPDFVSADLRRILAPDEAVIGLVLTHGGKQIMYAPSLPGQSDEWKSWVQTSDLCLFDGTFWDERELISAGISSKTAREIGHLPLSGAAGLLEEFVPNAKTQRVLIHINNTNPILDDESPQHRMVRGAGWEIAYDGMEFEL
jgi:pyrroloquinoline quinone biosynthesis protein B